MSEETLSNLMKQPTSSTPAPSSLATPLQGPFTLLNAACVALLVSTGCVGTPIPQPPPDENFSISKIVIPAQQPANNSVMFRGEAGAAPPNSVLHITNIDTTDAPTLIQVDERGAFRAQIGLENGQELRFQVNQDGNRLAPVDALYNSGAFVAPPRFDCLTIDLQRDFGSVAIASAGEVTLTFDNSCGQEIPITQTSWRTSLPAFALKTGLPATIVAGTTTATLTYTPTAAGDEEEILLISVARDGNNARYPVSLFGTAQ